MEFLNDLPQRAETHDTEELAEAAFSNSIALTKRFIIQLRDRKDYGTDFQLEALQGTSVTNLRVHVQLKGTDVAANADGSVSVAVARTNLNYLLTQPESIYVCYHVATQRLLARYAQDVYREYEHRGGWHNQDTVTVRFTALFDDDFQSILHSRILATGRSSRDQRLEWTATPPEQISIATQMAVPLIEVPTEPERAKQVLQSLYDTAQDSVISKSFARFAAILDRSPGAMDLAYLAEINLGLNRQPFDTDRVRKGIQVIEEAVLRGDSYPGPLLYSEGNAWAALGETGRALETYNQALLQLSAPHLRHIEAECTKNMGTVLYELGHTEAARSFYERALTLNPNLAEAHFAMALWLLKHSDDYGTALEHLDSVVRQRGSSLPMHNLMGWRIELLFRTDNSDSAFREIHNLLGTAGTVEWVWPWCAQQVLTFGRRTVDSSRKAIRFWNAFLQQHPDNHVAAKERLLCFFHLRANGVQPQLTFEEFKLEAGRVSETLPSEAAFLWDRIGHWAQHDGNWVEAERHYRKAYEAEPTQFGYCLGTSLNFLERYQEALPILLNETERPNADSMTWFQVAIAKEHTGDIAGAIEAYKSALDIEPNYDLAWFNLGGLYWNSRNIKQATATWQEAMKRFPEHALTRKVQDIISQLNMD